MRPGACLLVVGPSGSGKSTLALALAGLIPNEIPGEATGSLLVDGAETAASPGGLTGRVGLVFQDPAIQIVMDRVEDDVAFGLENRAWPSDRMHAAVPNALGSVGLGGQAARHARELSGGQQQRLALAGVLAAEPGLLVFDEPTANLDPQGASELFGRIAALRSRQAATIVLVEHRVDDAWSLADVVLALGSDGRPIAVGSPEQVLRDARGSMEAAGIWLPGSGGRALPETPDEAGFASPVLEASGLGFSYDQVGPVFTGVDLTARPGDRIALVGPNGGGKSTLARLLVGLLRPTSGSVRLAGRDPSRIPAADLAGVAGYVFQRPELQFLARRVDEEVILGLPADRHDAAASLMARLGLPLARYGQRNPYRLSGGEQRRLSLATALVRSPRVLVLDEPTFGQDGHGYETLVTIIDELVDRGTCLMVATHDERLVRDVAERTLRVEGGRVTEQ